MEIVELSYSYLEVFRMHAPLPLFGPPCFVQKLRLSIHGNNLLRLNNDLNLANAQGKKKLEFDWA